MPFGRAVRRRSAAGYRGALSPQSFDGGLNGLEQSFAADRLAQEIYRSALQGPLPGILIRMGGDEDNRDAASFLFKWF